MGGAGLEDIGKGRNGVRERRKVEKRRKKDMSLGWKKGDGERGGKKEERDVRKKKTLIPCPPPQKGPTPNPYMGSG